MEISGPVDTLNPLHGLPIDILVINQTLVSSLEPLRGIHLVQLQIGKTKVTDLSPLVGMPLGELHLSENKNVDLSPLHGLPLERMVYAGGQHADFSPLRGAPLKFVDMGRNWARDLDFLLKAPLEELDARQNKIADLSPLRGKPLKKLNIGDNNVSDLAPLQGAPIEDLSIHRNPLKDLTPLLKLFKLERLRVSKLGRLLEPLREHPSLKYIAYDEESYRPVADFWAEYDAHHGWAVLFERWMKHLFRRGGVSGHVAILRAGVKRLAVLRLLIGPDEISRAGPDDRARLRIIARGQHGVREREHPIKQFPITGDLYHEAQGLHGHSPATVNHRVA